MQRRRAGTAAIVGAMSGFAIGQASGGSDGASAAIRIGFEAKAERAVALLAEQEQADVVDTRCWHDQVDQRTARVSFGTVMVDEFIDCEAPAPSIDVLGEVEPDQPSFAATGHAQG